MRKLLLGNEAIAWGAIAAGLEVATGYPGTPSTEIMETLAKYRKEFGYNVEWSVNEKVALETAIGSSYAGARTLVTMKQVGLNVAADPLMTSAYLGINGGLVIVVADDPGPHSSQNEQDTRLFAKFAKLPVLDPSSPQEAKDMTTYAFELSEKLGIPVILRPTTRICHVSADVDMNELPTTVNITGKVFKKDPRWVIFPSTAYQRHKILNKLQKEMSDINNTLPFNFIKGEGDLGVIVAGNSYNYLSEVLSRTEQSVAILKIGTPNPIPEQLTLEFLKDKKTVLVIEEQEPVIEEQIERLAWRNKLDLELYGKGVLPREGEFSEVIVTEALNSVFDLKLNVNKSHLESIELPVRPPTLCAGCPHRSSFYIIKEAAEGMNPVYHGDIGCYTLGVMPPLQVTDTCLCMGAGINMAAGMSKVATEQKQIALIGDSTFFHSGITGVINTHFNKADLLVVILDNSTTAMTGHQPHPGIEYNLMGEPIEKVDIISLLNSIGIEKVVELNPFEVNNAVEQTKELLNTKGVKAVIFREACIAIKKRPKVYKVQSETCIACAHCMTYTGCPSLSMTGYAAEISPTCYGCGLCAEVCRVGSIKEAECDA